MKTAGDVALMPFPFTNLESSKKRPVLLLRKLDNNHDDWLVCMISSQLRQINPDLDWVLSESLARYQRTNLAACDIVFPTGSPGAERAA